MGACAIDRQGAPEAAGSKVANLGSHIVSDNWDNTTANRILANKAADLSAAPCFGNSDLLACRANAMP